MTKNKNESRDSRLARNLVRVLTDVKHTLGGDVVRSTLHKRPHLKLLLHKQFEHDILEIEASLYDNQN